MVEENRQEMEGHQQQTGFSISQATISRRKSVPTGEGSCSESLLRQRRQETMRAACEIHGGSLEDAAPAMIGMVETLERGKEEDLVRAMARSRKMKRKIIPKLYKEDLVKFESSNDNMLRSIALYYSKWNNGKG